ncbi:RNA polymerase subunit sigma-70 [Prauserella marina]|uniref:RNA polymerase sigma-70 factor, ECF subfamily n=1 Tax=Prauserella marina TaxID=530584 RepID=A0A222VUM7_9PSEU|nr:sigma-70 family RNA polymerase sigma factor [Prauserella marina]ASR37604.1 RNA polymerase subunit sigma-70 [Prauserella marina]PWV75512.1 RNA polymerase sigma-70 factor (ECF subfamily) [Prauserella marina]SDD32915.1 RNA polymerase sigma-70 factor, ECF subfamily [Prauserella marina]
MDEGDRLAAVFEEHRARLRVIAYRMLGSASEADDAVQETWLRLSRSDTGDVANLAGWLTTVVSRVCIDVLRSRQVRREDLVGHELPESAEGDEHRVEPEGEALLADAVGRALLVVLGTLRPAERVAFVLHDMFALPFDEIAPIVARSPVATKKLASRARQRLRGTTTAPDAEIARHRAIVEAFLVASRGGDLDTLVELLDPDVVRHADRSALPAGAATVVRGASTVARETRVFAARAAIAEPALIDGAVGVVIAPNGLLRLVLTVTIKEDRITEIEVIADEERLRNLRITVPGGWRRPGVS